MGARGFVRSLSGTSARSSSSLQLIQKKLTLKILRNQMHYLALLIDISHQQSPDHTSVDNRAFVWHFINGKSTTAFRRKRDQLLARKYWEPYHTSRLRIDGRPIGWPMAWTRFACSFARTVYETSDFASTVDAPLFRRESPWACRYAIHGSVDTIAMGFSLPGSHSFTPGFLDRLLAKIGINFPRRRENV